MKNVMSKLVILFAVAMSLSACGGKGGSSHSDNPGIATSAAGTAGYVGQNTWRGSIVVTDQARYIQFLGENGLCYGQQCSYVSGFFRLDIQTVTEMLPDAVNFTLTPRYNGYGGRSLRTQGDGYMNAGGNGFQIQYKRYNNGFGGGYGMGFGGGFGGYGNRPTTLPYGGVAQIPTPPTATANTLVIILTYVDATQSIANVTVQYQGVTIGTGQMRGLIPTGLNLGVQTGAPVTVPYFR